jgi:hypothetical protein
MTDMKPKQLEQVLCLPALVPTVDSDKCKGVTDIELKPGVSFRAFANGKLVGPVSYDGDRNALVNELSALVAPVGVRTKSRDVESQLQDRDGVVHTANIPVHTVHLVDG